MLTNDMDILPSRGPDGMFFRQVHMQGKAIGDLHVGLRSSLC